jgi:hypothetical protein
MALPVASLTARLAKLERIGEARDHKASGTGGTCIRLWSLDDAALWQPQNVGEVVAGNHLFNFVGLPRETYAVKDGMFGPYRLPPMSEAQMQILAKHGFFLSPYTVAADAVPENYKSIGSKFLELQSNEKKALAIAGPVPEATDDGLSLEVRAEQQLAALRKATAERVASADLNDTPSHEASAPSPIPETAPVATVQDEVGITPIVPRRLSPTERRHAISDRVSELVRSGMASFAAHQQALAEFTA